MVSSDERWAEENERFERVRAMVSSDERWAEENERFERVRAKAQPKDDMIQVPTTTPYPKDAVINAVINKFTSRADIGMTKYDTSMAGNTGGVVVWLEHTQQELMDAVNYIEKLIQMFTSPDSAKRG